MAIMVGSFTLQLPTSASVATLHAFAKPLRYRMFGGNSLMLGGFERCEVLIRFFLLVISDYGHLITISRCT